MKVFILEVIIVDNVNLEDIKELDNSDVVIAYDEVDKYIKYLKDSILDENEPIESGDEEKEEED